MTQAKMSCPKCSGEMVNGFVMDRSYGWTFVSQWVRGAPKTNSLMQGLISTFGIKLPKAGDSIPIGTFRCESCGFLESYAREEFRAQ